MKIYFERYHGLGNDYLVYDPQKNDMALNEKRIKLICDRNFGCGSDGILYGPILEEDRIRVRIYNPDGSEAEKSGNGVRIFSKYLKDFQYVTEPSFVLSTLGGDVDVQYLSQDGKLMKVLMGKVTYESDKIPVTGNKREVIDEPMIFSGHVYNVTCLSIGNPHCVIPMFKISREKAIELGTLVEAAPYFPNRINMQLLQVIDRHNIRIEIFERGAGYTLASGSSSCAAACAAIKLGLADSPVKVQMPGGELNIEIGSDESVYMTGTVNRVGTIVLADEFIDELNLL
jgi:diaminopimelate epimerase